MTQKNSDGATSSLSGKSGSGSCYELEPVRIFLKPGLILNEKWEILEHIASGGKGDVYLAHQKNLQRNVALKVISPNFVNSLEGNVEELAAEKERFRREVRAMASIRHPNVLQVFDFDLEEIEGNKLEYIVMEYIPGATLRSVIPDDGCGFDRKTVCQWLKTYYMPVLQGLAAVHEAGIIHRDIKPENIMLDGNIPKIADFGLARMRHQHGLTHTANILGTIFYMPKEQFEDGGMVDASADVYALGKILFELVHGKAANKGRLAFKQVGLEIEACAEEDKAFFARLDAIMRKATGEEPQCRTSSVSDLYRELRELSGCVEESTNFINTAPRNTFRNILHAGAVVLLLCGVFLYFYHTQYQEKVAEQHPASAVVSSAPVFSSASTPDDSHRKSEKLRESDGAQLKLVPGGEARLGAEPGSAPRTASVKSFYMEEGLVSNERYVTFLNAVKDTLTVQDAVVSFRGGVYLLLGEVREGYEPIVYRDGKFALSSGDDAGKPVVRVSPEGAQAYAHYYNRELPDLGQWVVARRNGLPTGYDQRISGEWGYEKTGETRRYLAFEAKEDVGDGFCPLARQKWECFPDVGFRTVRNITS